LIHQTIYSKAILTSGLGFIGNLRTFGTCREKIHRTITVAKKQSQEGHIMTSQSLRKDQGEEHSRNLLLVYIHNNPDQLHSSIELELE